MSQTTDIQKVCAFKKYTLAINGGKKVAALMKEKGLTNARSVQYETALKTLHIDTLNGIAEYSDNTIYFLSKMESIPSILSKINTAVVGEDSTLNVAAEAQMLNDVIIDLIKMLQPAAVEPDGSIGTACKDRVKTLIDIYTSHGGMYDRQYGVNSRSILALHGHFLDCVFDDARPFQLKMLPLKTFTCVSIQTSEFDVNNPILVRQHCRRYAQAITIAAGIILTPRGAQAFRARPHLRYALCNSQRRWRTYRARLALVLPRHPSRLRAADGKFPRQLGARWPIVENRVRAPPPGDRHSPDR